jgi:carbamoyltransferase
MLILGIADSHDASVSLIEDGKVIFAASEERFTRKKMQQGFPYQALKHACGFIAGRKIDNVYVCTKFGRAAARIFN